MTEKETAMTQCTCKQCREERQERLESFWAQQADVAIELQDAIMGAVLGELTPEEMHHIGQAAHIAGILFCQAERRGD